MTSGSQSLGTMGKSSSELNVAPMWAEATEAMDMVNVAAAVKGNNVHGG